MNDTSSEQPSPLPIPLSGQATCALTELPGGHVQFTATVGAKSESWIEAETPAIRRLFDEFARAQSELA